MYAIYTVHHDNESRLQLHEFPLLSKSFHGIRAKRLTAWKTQIAQILP